MAISTLPPQQPANPGAAKPQYDPNFTAQVIAATGPKANPRLAQIMPSLLRHLHDFAREVDLTVEEWTIGVEFINACGQMSTSSRNETQLLCNVLGLESLVDEITSALLASSASVTPSAVLGPFYRANAPVLPNGSSIVNLPPEASSTSESGAATWTAAVERDSTYLHGRVLSDSGAPIAGAEVDVWHAAPNGLYEQQDSEQPDMNLRGRFRTDADGRFALYCLRPVSYPIPYDGPSGRLLQALDRHPNRPAHIHFIVGAQGHRSLTTQVFDRRDPYLGDDAVFAVKDELVVDFVERVGDDRARWTLEFDFVLSKA